MAGWAALAVESREKNMVLVLVFVIAGGEGRGGQLRSLDDSRPGSSSQPVSARASLLLQTGVGSELHLMGTLPKRYVERSKHVESTLCQSLSSWHKQ